MEVVCIEMLCVVQVIVVGNGYGDLSSNPGLGSFHFYIVLKSLGKVWI